MVLVDVVAVVVAGFVMCGACSGHRYNHRYNLFENKSIEKKKKKPTNSDVKGSA